MKNDGEDNEEFNILFPGLKDVEDANIKDGFMTLAHEEVKAIFDPFVESVIRLVE